MNMENKIDPLASAKREIEISIRRKFQQELDYATEGEKDRYYQLLSAARRNRQDPKNPGLVTISTEERLKLIELAKSNEDITPFTRAPSIVGVDPIKMNQDWEGSTRANKGRPPIGGAVDD